MEVGNEKRINSGFNNRRFGNRFLHTTTFYYKILVTDVRLELMTISLAEANQFIVENHRHHKPVVGHKFSLSAMLNGEIVGVAIIGRPVARGFDDGLTLEITRLCSLGGKNVCSFLYGAAAKACFALGYKRIGTYILASETGTTLKAAGWRKIAEVKGRSWSCDSRPRIDKHPLQNKLYFSTDKEIK